MAKKMLFAILEDSETRPVMQDLQKAGYTFTLIDSTGSLLRKGKSTFIAAVDEEEVDGVIDHINQVCSPQSNPFQARGIVMVFAIDHFEQIP